MQTPPGPVESRDGGGDPQDPQVQIAQLQEALQARDLIGQAKGIIRLLTRCDSQAAFDLLVRMSSDTNRKVRDIAVLIADSAATGTSLPLDLAASWRWYTGTVADQGHEAGAGIAAGLDADQAPH